MRTFLLFASYIILALLLVPFLGFCLVFKSSAPLSVVARWEQRFGQRILGLRLQLAGLGQQRGEEASIYLPDHASFLEGPLRLMLISQHLSVVLKNEICRVQVLGKAMRWAEFIPVSFNGSSALMPRGRFFKKMEKYAPFITRLSLYGAGHSETHLL